MPTATLTINTQRPFSRDNDGRRQALIKFAATINAIISGKYQADAAWLSKDNTTPRSRMAFGVHTLASSSGTVTATIDGVAANAVFAVSDANTVNLLADAINAVAGINRKVTAISNRRRFNSQVTLTSVPAGALINVYGRQFQAFTAAVPAGQRGFVRGVSDTADALSLANAINADVSLNEFVVALNIAGVVVIGHLYDAPRGPDQQVVSLAASMVVADATTRILVIANVPGEIGNCCTDVATGTGHTFATLGTGKLGGGAGGLNNFLPVAATVATPPTDVKP